MIVKKRRFAIPAAEKNTREVAAVKLLKTTEKSEEDNKEENIDTTLFVPLLKANKEEQTVTGVVLQPEIVDAQGDVMSADVIRKAAHKFLASYNKATKLGLQHKDFKKRFELLESYLAPQEFVLKERIVKEGSWIMTVRVVDSKIWKKVKDGKITGFSIGGRAKVKKVSPTSLR